MGELFHPLPRFPFPSYTEFPSSARSHRPFPHRRSPFCSSFESRTFSPTPLSHVPARKLDHLQTVNGMVPPLLVVGQQARQFRELNSRVFGDREFSHGNRSFESGARRKGEAFVGSVAAQIVSCNTFKILNL